MPTLTHRSELIAAQLKAAPLANRAANGEPYVRTGATGSGDGLLVLRWTAADLARERAAGARLLGGFGISAGMRVANTLAGALVSPGALLLGDVVEEIGGLDVPLGFTTNEASAKAAWELIDRVQAEVLVVDKESAAALFAAAPAAAREWLQCIVWLQTASGNPRLPVPVAMGFSGWQRTWLAVAEAASFVAGDCTLANFHIDEGVEAEVVNDTLVLTTKNADSGLTRYATAIGARLLPSCPCGSRGAVVQLL